MGPRTLSVACRFHPGWSREAAGGPGSLRPRLVFNISRTIQGGTWNPTVSSSNSLSSFPGSLPTWRAHSCRTTSSWARPPRATFVNTVNCSQFRLLPWELHRHRNSTAAEVLEHVGERDPGGCQRASVVLYCSCGCLIPRRGQGQAYLRSGGERGRRSLFLPVAARVWTWADDSHWMRPPRTVKLSRMTQGIRPSLGQVSLLHTGTPGPRVAVTLCDSAEARIAEGEAGCRSRWPRETPVKAWGWGSGACGSYRGEIAHAAGTP